MKTLMLAVMGALALSATHMTAFANEVETTQDELRPADELAEFYGLNQDEALLQSDNGTILDEMDGFYPHPRPRPRPRPLPPHYPPYPAPVPPPHYGWWECSSQDRYGSTYTGRGRDPRWTQRDVHNHCEMRSGGYCYDLGCRRY